MDTITIKNRKYVLVPSETYDSLVEKAGAVLPAFPKAAADGSRPARATVLVSIARDIITRRVAANWTQEELATRAGVRPETISRLEGGKHRAQRETLARIDGVLRKAGV